MTFYQLFWCHSIILVVHLVKDSIWHFLLQTQFSLNFSIFTVFVENIAIPRLVIIKENFEGITTHSIFDSFLFLSAWHHFPDLWSNRNTFYYKGKHYRAKFNIIGNWRPHSATSLKTGKILCKVSNKTNVDFC